MYHHVAFRLTVYAMLVIIGGVNIWGEHNGGVPELSAQTSPTTVDNAVLEGSIDLTPTVKVGESYHIKVQVKNTGTSTWVPGAYGMLGEETPDMPAMGWTQANRWGWWPSNAIAPGQIAVFETWSRPASNVPGTYHLTFRMVDRDNNRFGSLLGPATITVTGNAPSPISNNLPNLVVNRVILLPSTSVASGTRVNYSAEIENKGIGNSLGAIVQIKYDGAEFFSRTEALNAGEKRVVTLDGNTPQQLGSHIVQVFIDPTNQIIETDDSEQSNSKVVFLAVNARSSNQPPSPSIGTPSLSYTESTRVLRWQKPDGTSDPHYWQVQRSPQAVEPTVWISNCLLPGQRIGGIYDGSTEPSNWDNCNFTPKPSTVSVMLEPKSIPMFYRVRAMYKLIDESYKNSAWSSELPDGWVRVSPSSAPTVQSIIILPPPTRTSPYQVGDTVQLVAEATMTDGSKQRSDNQTHQSTFVWGYDGPAPGITISQTGLVTLGPDTINIPNSVSVGLRFRVTRNDALASPSVNQTGNTVNIQLVYPIVPPPPALKPDLEILSLNITPAIPQPNQEISYSAVVKNSGGVASVVTAIQLFIGQEKKFESTVPPLAPSTQQIIVFGSNRLPVGPYNLRAVLDPNNLVDESNEYDGNAAVLVFNVQAPNTPATDFALTGPSDLGSITAGGLPKQFTFSRQLTQGDPVLVDQSFVIRSAPPGYTPESNMISIGFTTPASEQLTRSGADFSLNLHVRDGAVPGRYTGILTVKALGTTIERTKEVQFTVVGPPIVQLADLNVGDLIQSVRLPNQKYYFGGTEKKRYVFPPNDGSFVSVESAVLNSWYPQPSFRTISDADMATIPLSSDRNVTMKPGSLIQFKNETKVYAVSRGAVLHWIRSEAVASALFGATWNQNIPVSHEAFFANYQMGSDITDASQYNRAQEQAVMMEQDLATTFVVFPTPVITSLQPTSGPTLTTDVTITGKNFDATNNTVYFGNTPNVSTLSNIPSDSTRTMLRIKVPAVSSGGCATVSEGLSCPVIVQIPSGQRSVETRLFLVKQEPLVPWIKEIAGNNQIQTNGIATIQWGVTGSNVSCTMTQTLLAQTGPLVISTSTGTTGEKTVQNLASGNYDFTVRCTAPGYNNGQQSVLLRVVPAPDPLHCSWGGQSRPIGTARLPNTDPRFLCQEQNSTGVWSVGSVGGYGGRQVQDADRCGSGEFCWRVKPVCTQFGEWYMNREKQWVRGSVPGGCAIVLRLTITTATDEPVVGNIVAGAQDKTFAKIVMDATDSTDDIIVNSLVINDIISRGAEYGDIINLELWGDPNTSDASVVNQRLATSTATTVSASSVPFVFTAPIIVGKNTPSTLTLKADVLTTAVIQGTHTLKVGEVVTSTALPVTPTGSGQAQTIASSGALKVEISRPQTPDTSARQLLAGKPRNALVQYQFTASNEDIRINKFPIALSTPTTPNGAVIVPTITNPSLGRVSVYVSDTPGGEQTLVGAPVVITADGTATVDIAAAPLTIPNNNQSKYITLSADINTKEEVRLGEVLAVGLGDASGNASDWGVNGAPSAAGKHYNIVAVGKDSGTTITVATINSTGNAATGTIQSGYNMTVSAAGLTVALSASQPNSLSGLNSDLINFDLTATGDTVTIKDIEFVYRTTCTSAGDGLMRLMSRDKSQTYAIWAGDVRWLGLPDRQRSFKVLGAENATDRGAGGFDEGQVLSIGAGETKTLTLSGDMSGCTGTGSALQVGVGADTTIFGNQNTRLASGITWASAGDPNTVVTTVTGLPIKGKGQGDSGPDYDTSSQLSPTITLLPGVIDGKTLVKGQVYRILWTVRNTPLDLDNGQYELMFDTIREGQTQGIYSTFNPASPGIVRFDAGTVQWRIPTDYIVGRYFLQMRLMKAGQLVTSDRSDQPFTLIAEEAPAGLAITCSWGGVQSSVGTHGLNHSTNNDKRFLCQNQNNSGVWYVGVVGGYGGRQVTDSQSCAVNEFCWNVKPVCTQFGEWYMNREKQWVKGSAPGDCAAVETGNLKVSRSASTPNAQQFHADGTTQHPFVQYKFQAEGEPIRVKQISLALAVNGALPIFGISNIQRIYAYVSDTETGTQTPLGDPNGYSITVRGNADLDMGADPLTISINSQRFITLKAILKTDAVSGQRLALGIGDDGRDATTWAGSAGRLVQGLYYITAFGVVNNTEHLIPAETINTTGVVGGMIQGGLEMTALSSVLTVERSSEQPTSVVEGPASFQPVLRFTLKSTGGPIQINKLEFIGSGTTACSSVSGSGHSGKARLDERSSTGVLTAVASFTNILLRDVLFIREIDSMNITLQDGQTKEYQLSVDTNCTTDLATLQYKIDGGNSTTNTLATTSGVEWVTGGRAVDSVLTRNLPIAGRVLRVGAVPTAPTLTLVEPAVATISYNALRQGSGTWKLLDMRIRGENLPPGEKFFQVSYPDSTAFGGRGNDRGTTFTDTSTTQTVVVVVKSPPTSNAPIPYVIELRDELREQGGGTLLAKIDAPIVITPPTTAVTDVLITQADCQSKQGTWSNNACTLGGLSVKKDTVGIYANVPIGSSPQKAYFPPTALVAPQQTPTSCTTPVTYRFQSPEGWNLLGLPVEGTITYGTFGQELGLKDDAPIIRTINGKFEVRILRDIASIPMKFGEAILVKKPDARRASLTGCLTRHFSLDLAGGLNFFVPPYASTPQSIRAFSTSTVGQMYFIRGQDTIRFEPVIDGTPSNTEMVLPHEGMFLAVQQGAETRLVFDNQQLDLGGQVISTTYPSQLRAGQFITTPVTFDASKSGTTEWNDSIGFPKVKVVQVGSTDEVMNSQETFGGALTSGITYRFRTDERLNRGPVSAGAQTLKFRLLYDMRDRPQDKRTDIIFGSEFQKAVTVTSGVDLAVGKMCVSNIPHLDPNRDTFDPGNCTDRSEGKTFYPFKNESLTIWQQVVNRSNDTVVWDGQGTLNFRGIKTGVFFDETALLPDTTPQLMNRPILVSLRPQTSMWYKLGVLRFTAPARITYQFEIPQWDALFDAYQDVALVSSGQTDRQTSNYLDMDRSNNRFVYDHLPSFEVSAQQADLNAQFLSDTIPSRLRAGAQIKPTFTVKNTGIASWVTNSFDTQTGSYQVVETDQYDIFKNDYDNGTAIGTVTEGQEKTYTFPALDVMKTATLSLGTYALSFQMQYRNAAGEKVKFGPTYQKTITIDPGIDFAVGAVCITSSASYRPAVTEDTNSACGQSFPAGRDLYVWQKITNRSVSAIRGTVTVSVGFNYEDSEFSLQYDLQPGASRWIQIPYEPALHFTGSGETSYEFSAPSFYQSPGSVMREVTVGSDASPSDLLDVNTTNNDLVGYRLTITSTNASKQQNVTTPTPKPSSSIKGGVKKPTGKTPTQASNKAVTSPASEAIPADVAASPVVISGTLVKVSGSPAVYLRTGETFRPFVNADVFRAYGFFFKDVQTIPNITTRGAAIDFAVDDADKDGLTAAQEMQLKTDPSKQDTDGDGYWDGEEAYRGYNPLKNPDTGRGTPLPRPF